MKMPRGDFLGIGGNTFRSFTAAPAIQYAVSLAHRMARQRLEAGGTPAAPPKPIRSKTIPADFILPLDVDADEVRKAIERHLAERGSEPSADAPPLLKRKAGGRVVIPGYHLLRIADGHYDKGRAFLHGLVKALRARRWRMRSTKRR